ncbi:MAG: hypothetical protein J7540_02330, partial [Roseofilum sp. SID2]
ALIKRKFAGEPKAEMVLEEHESDPETYKAPLQKKLLEAGADRDREILAAAQKLLDEMKSKESTPGSFQTTFEGESINLRNSTPSVARWRFATGF